MVGVAGGGESCLWVERRMEELMEEWKNGRMEERKKARKGAETVVAWLWGDGDGDGERADGRVGAGVKS